MESAVTTAKKGDAASDKLIPLSAHALRLGATDVHIAELGARQVVYRSKGLLETAVSWEHFTDGAGKLSGITYREIADALYDKKSISSIVFRQKSVQVRVLRLPTSYGEKLLLRFQGKIPPGLTETLDGFPQAIDMLSHAHGMVIVSGPIGSGKTTTASGLVRHLCEQHKRHILCLEDPVEYFLEPAAGACTHIETDLTAGDDVTGATLRQIIPKALRADIDGLFLGEVRTAEAMDTCFAFAGTHEPVITTLQGGSIADALVRALNLASERKGWEMAKLTLTQCLHAIIHVDLAFYEKGVPVPVVLCMPAKSNRIRQIIADATPATLLNQINAALNDCRAEEGFIGPQAAQQQACKRGAELESVRALFKKNGVGDPAS